MICLIISDTHGSQKCLRRILEKENKIDRVLFLGDGIGELALIQQEYPHIPLDVVRGNCDIGSAALPMQILNLNGYKVLICHGDGFDVKMSLLGLRRAAIGLHVDIALYGHTHKQYYEYLDGLYLFCPGSVDKDIKGGFKSCYGIIDLNNEKPLFYHKEISE